MHWQDFSFYLCLLWLWFCLCLFLQQTNNYIIPLYSPLHYCNGIIFTHFINMMCSLLDFGELTSDNLWDFLRGWRTTQNNVLFQSFESIDTHNTTSHITQSTNPPFPYAFMTKHIVPQCRACFWGSATVYFVIWIYSLWVVIKLVCQKNMFSLNYNLQVEAEDI